MHELACPSCNAPSQYDLKNFLLLCPFCSASFGLDDETGKKEIFSDHYIVPNALDVRQVKGLILEWLRRLHYQAEGIEKEFFVVDITGFSMPYWIVSMEAHTMWKGLVERSRDSGSSGVGKFIQEEGHFRRNYRWALSARHNLCESWGMTRLHEPKEAVYVDWDGFPLDSTLSRGRIDANLGIKTTKEGKDELTAYDVREFFEFKFSNGLSILSVQVPEKEALRRSKTHVTRYQHALAKLNVSMLTDVRTELEIAGIQLIHLPFWHAKYVYHPRSLLKHFHRPKEKNVLIEGYTGAILKGELAIVQRDKLWINAIVSLFVTFLLFMAAALWHGSFFIVGLFTLGIGLYSGYSSTKKRDERKREKLGRLDDVEAAS